MRTLYATDILSDGDTLAVNPEDEVWREPLPNPNGNTGGGGNNGGGGNTGGTGGGTGGNTGTPENPVIVDPNDREPEIYDFDHAVFRYSWNASNGRDLDTRTRVSVPLRNAVVGWSRGSSDSDILEWVGDDTSENGTEGILFRLERLLLAYPSVDVFEVSLKAFWYSAKFDGNLKLQFESYRGGRMERSNYNWVNIGGQVTQSFIMDCHIDMVVSGDVDGVHVAKFVYDRVTESGRLIRV